MRWGVVTFPGSNDDRDMLRVAARVLGDDGVTLWHKDTDLKGAAAIVLPQDPGWSAVRVAIVLVFGTIAVVALLGPMIVGRPRSDMDAPAGDRSVRPQGGER